MAIKGAKLVMQKNEENVIEKSMLNNAEGARDLLIRCLGSLTDIKLESEILEFIGDLNE